MPVKIPKSKELEHKVFNIHNANELSSVALEVYRFQFEHNQLYRQYCQAIHKTPDSVNLPVQIPFLPISFFKTHKIETGIAPAEIVFSSSGTTGRETSRHVVSSIKMYEKSFLDGFRHFYGSCKDYCMLGLLPSYLERGGSSLVYMTDHLIKESGHPLSGFYLDETSRLDATIQTLEQQAQKTILIGVTYALLDFGRKYPQHLKYSIVMETGGMKGRHKEITRHELYQEFRDNFNVTDIHAEYGMTELLSQAYGINGKFFSPPWMKVLLRDETDPLNTLPANTAATGAINIIDLANMYSCSFIASDDIGRTYPDGSFEVLGRMDNSDIRGCSMLVV